MAASKSVVNAREAAKHYLAEHHIPQMFESLLSCLMLQRPEDPVQFIEKKMSEIRDVGVQNVDWETFVKDLHPYRNSVRLENIRDGSKFDREREGNEEVENQMKREKTQDYQPDLFQLTETS